MIVNGLVNGLDNTDRILKTGKGKGELGKADFMMLLIEQIKNQDPLDPMKGAEFTAHLAQFSILDQITGVNNTLENILLTEASLNNASAINLIGKRIEIEGNEIQLTSDGVDIVYRLSQGATTVRIDIYNNSGKRVATLQELPNQEGRHTVRWDGKGINGEKLPEDTYSFKVIANGPDGGLIDAMELMAGEAQELIFEGNSAYIYINNKKVPLGDILRVSIDKNKEG